MLSDCLTDTTIYYIDKITQLSINCIEEILIHSILFNTNIYLFYIMLREMVEINVFHCFDLVKNKYRCSILRNFNNKRLKVHHAQGTSSNIKEKTKFDPMLKSRKNNVTFHLKEKSFCIFSHRE